MEEDQNNPFKNSGEQGIIKLIRLISIPGKFVESIIKTLPVIKHIDRLALLKKDQQDFLTEKVCLTKHSEFYEYVTDMMYCN